MLNGHKTLIETPILMFKLNKIAGCWGNEFCHVYMYFLEEIVPSFFKLVEQKYLVINCMKIAHNFPALLIWGTESVGHSLEGKQLGAEHVGVGRRAGATGQLVTWKTRCAKHGKGMRNICFVLCGLVVFCVR